MGLNDDVLRLMTSGCRKDTKQGLAVNMSRHLKFKCFASKPMIAINHNLNIREKWLWMAQGHYNSLYIYTIAIDYC